MTKESEQLTEIDADRSDREVPWNAFAVGAALVFYLGLNVAMVLAAPLLFPKIDLKHPPMRLFLYIQTFLNVLFVCVVPWVLAWTTGAKARSFGIERGSIVGFIGTGIAGGVMMFPVIFLVNGVVMKLIGSKEHPVAELMKGDRSASYLAFSFFSVVIVAPLAEELFFRVILQGWLEKVASSLTRLRRRERLNQDIVKLSSMDIKESVEIGAITEGRAGAVEDNAEGDDRVEFDRDLTAAEGDLEEVRSDVVGGSLPAGSWIDEELTGERARFGRLGIVPNVIASTGFALAHMTVWPTPIPLFVLSLGIGYVYSRTRSWAACAAMHATFNEINLLILVIYLQSRPG